MDNGVELELVAPIRLGRGDFQYPITLSVLYCQGLNESELSIDEKQTEIAKSKQDVN